MSNQQKRQQSVRGVTGTTGTYAEDWIALFDTDAVAAGHFNDRLRAWINAKLSTSYANVNDAMRAYAVAKGVSRWGELGTFDPTTV